MFFEKLNINSQNNFSYILENGLWLLCDRWFQVCQSTLHGGWATEKKIEYSVSYMLVVEWRMSPRTSENVSYVAVNFSWNSYVSLRRLTPTASAQIVFQFLTSNSISPSAASSHLLLGFPTSLLPSILNTLTTSSILYRWPAHCNPVVPWSRFLAHNNFLSYLIHPSYPTRTAELSYGPRFAVIT